MNETEKRPLPLIVRLYLSPTLVFTASCLLLWFIAASSILLYALARMYFPSTLPFGITETDLVELLLPVAGLSAFLIGPFVSFIIALHLTSKRNAAAPNWHIASLWMLLASHGAFALAAIGETGLFGAMMHLALIPHVLWAIFWTVFWSIARGAREAFISYSFLV